MQVLAKNALASLVKTQLRDYCSNTAFNWCRAAMSVRLKQQRISAKGGCLWCQLYVVNLTKLRKMTVFIEQDQRESCGNEGLRMQFYLCIYLFILNESLFQALGGPAWL